jgi:hypothetical protein
MKAGTKVYIMSQRVEVELDDQDRLVLPSSVGRRLGLLPGMTLVVEQETGDVAYLRVQREQPRLVEKGGVLVVEAEPVAELDESVRREREQRMADLSRQVGL